MTDISRRGFIVAGGTVAGAWLAADAANLLAAGEHAARSARTARENGAPAPLQYLTQAQAADLDAAAAQIVPSDDLPGAHEAGVVYFIDKSLATWAADQRDSIKQGLDELHARAAKLQSTNGTQQGVNAARFAALSAEQRHAVIESLATDRHPFFFALKGATMTGMLANPEWGGNVNKAGWKMIGFDDRFSWAPPFGWYDAHA